MRRVGMTDPIGDSIEIIVHMSQAEWETFNMLETAVVDEYPDDFWHPSTGVGRGTDLAPVFGAIRLWCQLRFKTGALMRQINLIIEELERKEIE
jgi:hypothetical protein